MSIARILWLSRVDAERQRRAIHHAAIATRAAGAKKEAWEKFEKEVGDGNA